MLCGVSLQNPNSVLVWWFVMLHLQGLCCGLVCVACLYRSLGLANHRIVHMVDKLAGTGSYMTGQRHMLRGNLQPSRNLHSVFGLG